jgi:hypothetical protein
LPAVVALFAICGDAAAGSGTDPEDDLKSAIVLSFLRYSEWRRGGSSAAPLTIGVVGRASLIQALRKSVDGKSFQGRPIRVVDLRGVSELRPCQVVYVATDDSAEIRQALAVARGAGALAIGEDDHFLDLGGAVNLLTLDGRMTFEVNLSALERSGVAVSSKLLRFGHIWERGKVRPAG